MSLEILVLQALKKVNPPTRQIVNGVSKNGLRVWISISVMPLVR
jgi:hypothetical protein